jgi:large subunit ribosomal protein L4
MTDTTHVTLPVVSQSRAPAGDVSLPAALVNAPARQHLLYEAVKSQRAGWRAGTSSTKTRGEVRGGGKKPWRQKGTGRARAGSIRSPLWAGGAIIFGPQPRSFAYRMPRSARRAALRAAVSARYAEERLLILDAIELPAAKTKEVVALLGGLGIEGSTLIVTDTVDESLLRSARNLPTVKVLPVAGFNVYDVLRHEHLVMTRSAAELLAERLGGRA